MAEVTNELMYEIWRAVQARLEQVDGKIDELKHEALASRTQMQAVRQELNGMHMTLVRHEQRLDRIDRRLEITESPASAP
jgi:tetrahydromethanopterin S-methyltransferase subunit G